MSKKGTYAAVRFSKKTLTAISEWEDSVNEKKYIYFSGTATFEFIKLLKSKRLAA